MSTAEFVASVAGLVIGLLIGLLLGLPLSDLPAPSASTCHRRLDLFRLRDGRPDGRQARGPGRCRRGRRFVRRSEGQAPNTHGGETQVVVDTSAIIDGRIADIVESGFLYHRLIIPHFVSTSCSGLPTVRTRNGAAEAGAAWRFSPDSRRAVRRRSRSSMKILPRWPMSTASCRPGQGRGAAILTNDFNLNRVADLQSIRVLNINSLANALKPALLLGTRSESRSSPTVRRRAKAGLPGRRHDGRRRSVRVFVGHEVDVLVTRVLQT